MNKKYKIKITELYTYKIDINANSKKEAIEKAKYMYEKDYEDCGFLADATTLQDTKFKAE